MNKSDLKQQAKGLLLKGCYKMAFNKYNRLIEMGSQGFSKRDWAIIHLNQAICLQFQEHLEKAIQTIERALQIDPTYEKAYYRQLQILKQMNQHEKALNSVPLWLKNKEIQQLLGQIKQEYLNSMGMDQLLQNLISKNEHKMEFIKQSHSKFYQRVSQAIDSDCSMEHMKKVGEKIGVYYKYLKDSKLNEILQQFLSKIHFLLIGERQSKKKQAYQSLFSSFWPLFQERADAFQNRQFTPNDIKEKEEYKIIKYSPLSKTSLRFLQSLALHQKISQQCMFEQSIQLSNNLCRYSNQHQYSRQVYNIICKFIQKLSTSKTYQRLSWLKRSFILIDTLIKLHLALQPSITFQQMNLAHLFYLHYYFANHPQEHSTLQLTPFKGIKTASIIQYIDANLDQFLVVYTCQHFLHRLDRNLVKELSTRILQQLQILHQLKEISGKGVDTKMSTKIILSAQFQLIYTSMLLKIDLKNTGKVNIGSILSQGKSKKKHQQSLSDLQINTLLLLAVSRKENLIEILKHQETITQVISQLLANTFLQQIQSLKVVTSLIYLLVIDLQIQLQEEYAGKMGTSVQEIRKAKKIQGEKQDTKTIEELKQRQGKFKEYICKNWQEIIASFSGLLLKIKDQPSLKKWGKVLNAIGKIDHSRFHNPKIISILLQIFKIQKKDVGQLFSVLCKKINVDLIKYQHFQSIANVLVRNVQKHDDQLVIFQSLLGLINFTSNSNNKVKIPIKTIVDAAFQQNKYIVHASCSLLNNLLVYEENQEINKLLKLKQIVEKYVIYYRQQLENDEGVPLSDYSHPSRVYSTLLSLAMVLDLHQLYQFQNWKNLEGCMLRIKTSRSDILYKGVWYLSMKERLQGKWWEKFQKDLKELQVLDHQRWLKLQHYIKK